MPTYDRFTGLRNDKPAERLGPHDLVGADNVDLDDSGAVRRRAGYRKAIAGADVHSMWSTYDGSLALYVDGTKLFRVNDGGVSATELADGLTPKLPMSYWMHAGRVYHSNGSEAGVYEDGAVRSWGLDVPAAPVLSAAPGQMDAGRYQVVTTYVTADGQESGCGAASAIELATVGGIGVQLRASSDPRVTLCRLYCTTTNGTQLYWAGDVANGTVALVISGGHDDLQRPLQTQFYGPAPSGQFVAYYRGHMLVARGNLIQVSAPFGLELFRPADHIAFASRIRMIAPVDDGIYVSDSEFTYWCAGANPLKFDEIKQRHDAPAIEGTLVYARGARIGRIQGQFQIPMWLTSNGVVAGSPGGELNVLTNQYRFDAPARGAGLFRKQRETYQYLASFQGA